jgi:hypothetical protein
MISSIRVGGLSACRFVAALIVTCAVTATAQQQAAAHSGHDGHGKAPVLSRDEIATLAKVTVQINAARDSANVQLSKSGNKTAQAQTQLQDKLREEIKTILTNGGLSQGEYQRRTFLVSTDTTTRRIFDSVVVVVSGAPLPGYAARAAILPVPPGPAGVHVGHVVNGFNETPSLQGLLPMAVAEARVAIGHATLAGRQPTNLEYMKTHSGHVIHALDPTAIKLTAPGLGYGVKKAALGAATHMELAAAAEGAPANIVTHSKHIATAARSAAERVDRILALAQKVLTATTAEEAAALIAQYTPLAEQLMAGVDANADGRITWEAGEGGLQHAEEHVRLMLPRP